MEQTYTTVAEMLDAARDYHVRLSGLYTRLRALAEREEVRIFLAYMSQREKRLAADMRAYKGSLPKEVRDAWFQIAPAMPKPSREDAARLAPEATFAEVVDFIVEEDQRLVNVYREVARLALSERVRETFAGLADAEEREEREAMQIEERLEQEGL